MQVLFAEATPMIGVWKGVKILLLWKLHKQLKRAIIDPSLNSSKQMTPVDNISSAEHQIKDVN